MQLGLLAEALQRAIARRDDVIDRFGASIEADRRALSGLRRELDRLGAKLAELDQSLERRAVLHAPLRAELELLQAPGGRQSIGSRDELLRLLGETRVALRRVSAQRDALRHSIDTADRMHVETIVLDEEQAREHTLPTIESLMMPHRGSLAELEMRDELDRAAGPGSQEAVPEELLAADLIIFDSGGEHAEPRDSARRVLVSLQGDGSAPKHSLAAGVVLVGRSPKVGIQLDHESVSRIHARLVVSDTEVVVEDLASKNGVEVNAEKVSRRALRDGDVVRFGTLRFQFIDDP
jgi:hypothetical protein